MIQKHWHEFAERAKAFGHDPKVLFRGEEITGCHIIETPDAFRSFVAATPEQRKQRLEQFFTSPLRRRQRLPQGVHDRVECYVLAGGTLQEADFPKINTHFPVSAHTLSVAEKRIGKNECWDVTASVTDPPAKTYTLVNVGRLILEEGAHIIVRGDVFFFLCQELIVHPAGKGSTEGFHIGILSGQSVSSFQNEPFPSIQGKPGLCGADGKSDYSRRTLLGPILNAEVHPADLNGSGGQNGENGLPGHSGANGNLCYIAEIAIRELHGDLTVYTRAGDGEDGTAGTGGGRGGDGGNGAQGCRHLNGILPSGNGGNGGNGGSGGNGGNGGRGGISSNVYLLVPPEAETRIRCEAFPSVGGKGGCGGPFGRGGKAGKGGTKNGDIFSGSNGTDGVNGVCGKNGRDGKSREAATVFINEKIVDTNLY